jgi:hypothetical protein
MADVLIATLKQEQIRTLRFLDKIRDELLAVAFTVKDGKDGTVAYDQLIHTKKNS